MTKDLFTYFRTELLPKADRLSGQYLGASPIPHVVIDDFLPKNVAAKCRRRFPAPDTVSFEQPDFGTHQVKKLGRTQDSYFEGIDPWLRGVLAEFNTMPFLDFLERLTGIAGLIPDPHFWGGTFHQILPGGHLDMHVDFNVDRRRSLRRRVNVFFYLNKGWRSEYGGSLLLRHADSDDTVRILPSFNRCVIFNTDSWTHHGHPEPLNVPTGVTRKSMALYYYVSDLMAFDQNVPHTTLWQPN